MLVIKFALKEKFKKCILTSGVRNLIGLPIHKRSKIISFIAKSNLSCKNKNHRKTFSFQSIGNFCRSSVFDCYCIASVF